MMREFVAFLTPAGMNPLKSKEVRVHAEDLKQATERALETDGQYSGILIFELESK